MLPGFPRKVMRIKRDTMTADSRSRIEGHKAERLGSGGADDLPGVDVERVTKPGHLVRHADVYGTKCILEKLGRFGDSRRANGVDFVDDLRIKGRSRFS